METFLKGQQYSTDDKGLAHLVITISPTASEDEETGDIILKTVNSTKEENPIQIHLDHSEGRTINPVAEKTVLTHELLNAINAMVNKENVIPAKSRLNLPKQVEAILADGSKGTKEVIGDYIADSLCEFEGVYKIKDSIDGINDLAKAVIEIKK